MENPAAVGGDRHGARHPGCGTARTATTRRRSSAPRLPNLSNPGDSGALTRYREVDVPAEP